MQESGLVLMASDHGQVTVVMMFWVLSYQRALDCVLLKVQPYLLSSCCYFLGTLAFGLRQAPTHYVKCCRKQAALQRGCNLHREKATMRSRKCVASKTASLPLSNRGKEFLHPCPVSHVYSYKQRQADGTLGCCCT